MTDRGPLYDQNETPEDVATLYSWANLHGAKYRDFSASRAQTREKARLRVLQAIEAEQSRAQQLAGAEQPAEIQNLADVERAAGMRRMAEQAEAAEEARDAELAAQQAAHEAAQQAVREAADKAAREAGEEAARRAAELRAREAAAEAARQAAEEEARQAAEEAARQAAEEAARKAAEQAAHQAAEQAARQAAEEAARRAAQIRAQQQAEREAEEATRVAAEKAAQQLAAQRAAQEAELQATRLAAEKAAQQLAAQRAALQAQAAKDAAERAAEQAARQAAEQAARQAAEQAAERAAQEAAQKHAAQEAAQKHAAQEAAQRAVQEAAELAARQQAHVDRSSAPPAAEAAQVPAQPAAPFLPRRDYPGYAPAQTHAPIQSEAQPAAMHEDSYPLPHVPWAPGDQYERVGRPAWLMPDRADAGPQPAVPQAPEDTLQGSRDRLTSRWYALRGVFEGAGSTAEAAPAPLPARAPVVAIFSLAGGVGKTSLVATLGRALSARGERVLLVDTAPYGLLPFFFGARDQRPGLLRTFSPPGNAGDAPIQMVTIDPEGLGPDTGSQDALTGEIGTYSRGASRVIVDLATASGATTRRILRMTPLVLVPLVPDMNSVVSFSSIDSFFQHNGSGQGKPSLPNYVLNQFDPSLPLHLDIREVLREQLGDRLLPFAIRRAPAVSEALAEGMTVMDYAPNSTVAEDFGSLAGWVKSQSAAASSTYRGVRWSER
jgi:cellulose synthase operon protein YhjQ